MTDFNEQTITQAVLDRFADTPDARLKRIMTSLVRHLHDFVRDVEPSFAEWQVAIEFLTRTGHMSSETRQEFILLSDTLGVSMLVDAINHRMPAGATETTVFGPFYVRNPPELPNGADVSPGMAGEPLYVEGTVSSASGERLAGAVVDIWHSDKDGFYDVQKSGAEHFGRARFRTDAEGRFWFWTIQPAFYPIPDDGPVGDMLKATNRHPYRPAHVHFMISEPGYETLVTHVFVEGDPYLGSDAVFGVKQSLICEFKHEPAGTTAPDGRRMDTAWRHLSYDFGLKPEGASVARAAAE
ncbi:MAG: intradiol ring-cleavage dioxygenase [Acetobacteraceae bacterium]|nr:intradiol ring-cleavage dioxygenase [Planctomycetaceae bacterium]MBV8591550.1 intradiol ring-cleavage dioxygenase [Acetobacteraceae bacterium]